MTTKACFPTVRRFSVYFPLWPIFSCKYGPHVSKAANTFLSLTMCSEELSTLHKVHYSQGTTAEDILFSEPLSGHALWLFSTKFSTLPAKMYSSIWKWPWSIWLEILSKSWSPMLFRKSHLIRTCLLIYSFLFDSWTFFPHKVRFSEFKSENLFMHFD